MASNLDLSFYGEHCQSFCVVPPGHRREFERQKYGADPQGKVKRSTQRGLQRKTHHTFMLGSFIILRYEELIPCCSSLTTHVKSK